LRLISGEESSEIVDDGLENMEVDGGVQNADLLDPACSNSIEGEGTDTVLEEAYGEEVDSDDDYASIQRPAFAVEGEPDFDSGPPEDGLEFLRRVRYHPVSYFSFPLPIIDASIKIQKIITICQMGSLTAPKVLT
jgi:survival of motor neuron protein-interacting protein 1